MSEDELIEAIRKALVDAYGGDDLEDGNAARAALAVAKREMIERCAQVADTIAYPIPIDEWNSMTKKDHANYACKQVAARIRSLADGE